MKRSLAARLRTTGLAVLLAGSMGLTVLGTTGASASSNGGSNTTMTQTTAATKDLSSLTWWIWYRPIASLDPVKYADYPEQLIIPNMCESLVAEVPGQKIVPDLATSWSQPSPTTVVFNIRHGVKFWDGTPMTSADVVYSLDRNFVTANESIYAYEPAFEDIKSVTATGPYTVTVTLKTPNVTFVPEMASLGGAIVEKAFTQKAGTNFGTPAGKVMCTGPYKLQSWNGNSSLTMVRNTDYWNTSGLAKTKTVTFVWPQDPGQVASAFEDGTFAGGFDILPSDFQALEKATSGKFYVGPSSQSMEIQAMIVIGNSGAIANQDVRQALSLSVPRQAMINALFYGIGIPAYTYVPAGYFSYDTSAFQKAYNAFAAPYASSATALAAAKKLVKEAGAVAKKPIVLAIQGSSPDAANEGQIIEQAADSVGLNLKLKVVSDAQYGALFSDPAARKGYDLIQTTNYDGDPDPLAVYTDIALPGAISNFDNFSVPSITKVLNQALATTNTTQRANLTIEAQTAIMKQMPWIPIDFVPSTTFVRNGVCGVDLDFSQMYGSWMARVGGC